MFLLVRPKMRQTTVHVPACAVAAVDRIALARGWSRDQAVRQLLAAHVDRQLECDAPDRLTHISTIMRHPLKPIYPDAWPDPRVRLSMRLPEGLAALARDVALVLPGQTQGGGIADYQARRLTDSVMTAIAAVEPLTDELLAGLRGCVRHQAAVGLWRLVVAATLTSEEQRVVLDARDGADDATQRVVELLREEDSAWHDQFRVQVVRHLVRRYLTEDLTIEGLDRDWLDGEEMLYDQRDGQKWAEVRDEFERFGLADEAFDDFNGWGLNVDGRGGAHVWRLQRRVVAEHLCSWLWDSSDEIAIEDRMMVAVVPGWTLQLPNGWTVTPVSRPDRMTPSAQQAVDAGLVLLLQTTSPERWFLWPMAHDEAGVLQPIPGFADVVAALVMRPRRGGGGARTSSAKRLPAEGIAELLLVVDVPSTVEMPVHIAYQAGLIDQGERDETVAAARRTTHERMEEFVRHAQSRLSSGHLDELVEAMNNPTVFRRIAYREGLPVSLRKRLDAMIRVPTHRYAVASLAQAVDDRLSAVGVNWLTKQVLRTYCDVLKTDRIAAWQRALDNNRHRGPWRGVESRPGACDTEA